jgi:LmbE family N-acetylglucosaminyl deacetylase
VRSASATFALAIYAHPDDADVAAGTLWPSGPPTEWTVHLVVICDGAKGSHSPHAGVGRVMRERREEFEFALICWAWRVSRNSLDWPDGTVTNSLDLRETAGRPDSCEYCDRRSSSVPTRRPPSSVGLRQPPRSPRDRLGTSRRRCASRGHAAVLSRSGPAPPSERLLLSGTHEPDVVVDVSRMIDVKVKAVLAHVPAGGRRRGHS